MIRLFSVSLMQPLTAGNPYLRKYEIFLCHFLDDRHCDDCRSNAGAGERYAGAQPHISGRALHRFGFYANGRGQSAAGFELQRHDFRQRLRTTVVRRERPRGVMQ